MLFHSSYLATVVAFSHFRAILAIPLVERDTTCAEGTTIAEANYNYTLLCDVDYPGGDFAYAQASSFLDCVGECDSIPECTDAQYTDGNCYLKSALTSPTSKPGVNSAVRIASSGNPPISSCQDGQIHTAASGVQYKIACDTDYFGGDFSHAQTSTFSKCIDACDSYPNCTDVQYTDNNCYLKSVLTSPVSKSGTNSAIRIGTTTSQLQDGQIYTAKSGDQYMISSETDYYGGDLINVQATSMEACIEACDTTSGCIDVSLRGAICYLKSTSTDARSDINVNSAKKIATTTTTAAAPAFTGTCGGSCSVGPNYVITGAYYPDEKACNIACQAYTVHPCKASAWFSSYGGLCAFLTNPVQDIITQSRCTFPVAVLDDAGCYS